MPATNQIRQNSCSDYMRIAATNYDPTAATIGHNSKKPSPAPYSVDQGMAITSMNSNRFPSPPLM